jgi:hypothetical protein
VQADQSSSSSRNLGAAFLPGDSSSGIGIQTLSQPSGPPPRSNKFLLLGTALGIVVAGGGFLAFGMRPPEPQVREFGHAAASTPSSPKASWPATAPNKAMSDPAQPNGLSIDSLPEDPGMAGRPGFVPKVLAPRSNEQDKLQKDMEALRVPPKQSDPAKVTLAEEDRVAEVSHSVKLDNPDTPAPAPQAPSSSGDFDRAAASAALSRVASLVAMCHRPGGDSGPGKALVTFGPNGHVQSVSIQGFNGGPVADCIANQFRSAKITPFTGDPVTVGKGFVIPD